MDLPNNYRRLMELGKKQYEAGESDFVSHGLGIMKKTTRDRLMKEEKIVVLEDGLDAFATKKVGIIEYGRKDEDFLHSEVIPAGGNEEMDKFNMETALSKLKASKFTIHRFYHDWVPRITSAELETI